MLLAGKPPPGRTGKLNAMMLGEARAQGELIAFSDSDTRPGPHLVRVLIVPSTMRLLGHLNWWAPAPVSRAFAGWRARHPENLP